MQHKIFIECVLIYSFNTPFRHILIESIIPNSFKYIFTLSKADLQPFPPTLVLFFFFGGDVYEYLSCISCLYIYWNHHTMFTIFIDPSILPQKHKVDVTEHWNNPPTPRTLLCPSFLFWNPWIHHWLLSYLFCFLSPWPSVVSVRDDL